MGSHSPSVFFGPEEEFDCPQEEECEIDWDKMPGFADDDNDNNKVEEEAYSYEELQPRESSFAKQVHQSLEKSRLMFEMSWQVDECNVNHDSCSDFCPDCSGSGRQFCKFCRGTRNVAFGTEFRICMICTSDGKVACPTCRGTGSIAPWVREWNAQL
jgi:hypothetical protein